MQELFDTSHWSRKPIKSDADLLVVAQAIVETDILKELFQASEAATPAANCYKADMKYTRAKLYSYINETCRSVDLSNTVTIGRYLQAAAAALRLTDPNDVDYPRLMNRIFVRLHRDGCVEDYSELLDAVVTPMLDSALSYARAYEQLTNVVILIGPGDELWDDLTKRNNERA